jgi:hypothetical protein
MVLVPFQADTEEIVALREGVLQDTSSLEVGLVGPTRKRRAGHTHNYIELRHTGHPVDNKLKIVRAAEADVPVPAVAGDNRIRRGDKFRAEADYSSLARVVDVGVDTAAVEDMRIEAGMAVFVEGRMAQHPHTVLYRWGLHRIAGAVT